MPVDIEDRKRIWASLGIVTALAMVIVALFLISLGSGSVDVSIDEEGFTVSAPLVDENISYEDIVSIEVRDYVDFGSRKNGFGGSKVLGGIFDSDEFGDYTLACYKDIKKYIVIEHTAGKILVLNQGSVETTILLYDKLFEKLNLA